MKLISIFMILLLVPFAMAIEFPAPPPSPGQIGTTSSDNAVTTSSTSSSSSSSNSLTNSSNTSVSNNTINSVVSAINSAKTDYDVEIESLKAEIEDLKTEIEQMKSEYVTAAQVLSMIQQNTPNEELIKLSLEESLAPPSVWPIYFLIFILFLGVSGLGGYLFMYTDIFKNINFLKKSSKKSLPQLGQPVIRRGPHFDAMVNYVKQNKENPNLKSMLVQQGWSPAEIREAFKEA